MRLDFEEQEQVAELKAWWTQYGNLVVSAIVAAALTFAGWQAWRWYERSQAAQAGALYDTLLRAARFYFERNDLKGAKAQLQWVIDHARQEDFRDLARLRYAAVLLDEKAYDEALKLLDEKHAAAYDAQYAAAKGDVLVAKNQAEQARAAYRIALDKAGSGNTAFRDSVRMRLEALGG